MELILELILRFGSPTEGGYPVLARYGKDQAEGYFSPPLDEAALIVLRRAVEGARTQEGWRVATKALVGAGARLFESLFSANPDLLHLYCRSPTQAQLALQFDEGAEELLSLPCLGNTSPIPRSAST